MLQGYYEVAGAFSSPGLTAPSRSGSPQAVPAISLALLWACSNRAMDLLCWGPPNWTQHSRWGVREQSRGRGAPPLGCCSPGCDGLPVLQADFATSQLISRLISHPCHFPQASSSLPFQPLLTFPPLGTANFSSAPLLLPTTERQTCRHWNNQKHLKGACEL